MWEMGITKEHTHTSTIDVVAMMKNINQMVIDTVFDMDADQERAHWAEIDNHVKRACD